MNLTYAQVQELRLDGSDAARTRVIDFARRFFDVAYYSARADAIRALAAVGMDPARRDAVVELVRAGLRTALWRGEPRASEDTDAETRLPGLDANHLGVAAAAHVLGQLGAAEAEGELREALAAVSHPRVHYELRMTAAQIGVALLAIGADATAALEPVLASYEAIWGDGDHRFIAALRYAGWVARGDAAGALAWLSSRDHSRPFAAAAIADLDAKHLAGELAALSAAGPTRRAIELAVERLQRQTGVPAPGDRMVWGLGLWHKNEPAAEFPEIYATLVD